MRYTRSKRTTGQAFRLRQSADVSWYLDDTARAHTACFTGHRHLSAAEVTFLPDRLDAALNELYWQGIRTFICGGALGFDTLAAEAVLRLRTLQSDVRLCIAIPCSSQSDPWSEEQQAIYDAILRQADESVTLSPVYFNGCMQVRNRYMVNRSSCVVAYLKYLRGGTLSTVTYAVKQDVRVINLAMQKEP